MAVSFIVGVVGSVLMNAQTYDADAPE